MRANWQEVKTFLKPTSRLGMLDQPIDLLGHPIHLGKVGEEPMLSARSHR